MADSYDCGDDILTDIAGDNEVDKFDPTKQFSKRLARLGAIVWTLYVFALLALVAYRPEAAMACVWLTLIMTANKALDTLSYTKNSITEKMLLAGIERTKFEVSLRGIGKSTTMTHDNNNADDDATDDEASDDDDVDENEVANG